MPNRESDEDTPAESDDPTPKDTTPRDITPKDAPPQDSATQRSATQRSPTRSSAPQDTAPQDTAAGDTAAVEALGLTVEFTVGSRSLLPGARRRIRAIDGLSFTVARGEAVGYLGPGGSGKTSLAQLVSGFLTPTGGSVRTCGLHPVNDRGQLSGRIGVVFGRRSQLWWDLPLVESLRILGRLHRLPEQRKLDRQAELVERLELGGFIDTPVRQLSPGRRMRGELAAALLHEPELLILDEPTTGLDVRSKERLRSFLRQENRVHGRTLLIATGDIGDIESVCSRLLVVERGQLAYDGTLRGLIARVGAERVLVFDLIQPGPDLDDVPGARLIGVEAGGLRQRLSVSPGRTTTARVLADVAARADIRNLTVEEPTIEDIVRRLGLPT
jgi:ABC-2 type transport system ATP-binding protein